MISQHQIILRRIREKGSTTVRDLQLLGINSVTARLSEMRRIYPIKAEKVTYTKEDGSTGHYSKYFYEGDINDVIKP